MTVKRYEPRSFAVDAHNFGRVRKVRWKPDEAFTGSELDYLLASKMQHAYAVVINEQILDHHGSIREYAASAGHNYQRLGRMLRGEIVMRLDDITNAERQLGIGLRRNG
ncbi:MAG: hypothetical protein WED09_13760 [Homoserinimonas sp.]